MRVRREKKQKIRQCSLRFSDDLPLDGTWEALVFFAQDKKKARKFKSLRAK